MPTTAIILANSAGKGVSKAITSGQFRNLTTKIIFKYRKERELEHLNLLVAPKNQ